MLPLCRMQVTAQVTSVWLGLRTMEQELWKCILQTITGYDCAQASLISAVFVTNWATPPLSLQRAGKHTVWSHARLFLTD